MYNNTQALAAAELQSFAGILQPHFHAHEITLKTNGTWPTQLFFAHPIKLFHFASVSVWPGGRNWGNKMRIWRLFTDPELFGSPQRCRILKCVFNFNGTNSFKCSLLKLLSPNLTTNSEFIQCAFSWMFSTTRLFWQKKQQIKKKELVLIVKEFVERNSEFVVWSSELPFIKLCKELPNPEIYFF